MFGGETNQIADMLGQMIRMMLLGLLFIHLTHFWQHMQLQEFMGNEAENPYVLLENTFGRWWLLVIYIIWFVAIWFHLNHGFWSMFQSVGWNNQIWIKRLQVIAVVVSTVIILGFVTVAVNAFLQANGVI